MDKQFCKKGHNVSICGRTGPQGHCKECMRLSSAKRRKENPEAARTSQREYRAANPNKYRFHQWKRYGIKNEKGEPFTGADYDRHFQLQKGRCKLQTCNKQQSELKIALTLTIII